jgi:hypothetical protein
MPLAKNKQREHKLHERALNIAPANAGDVFFVGAYLVREAATVLATPGVDAAGVVPLGVVVEAMFPDDPDFSRTAHLDNTAGADGIVEGGPERVERAVRYDQIGEYAFPLDPASDPPKVGSPAYLVDDDTVAAQAGVGEPSVNGIIAGHFTRPAPHGGWFIDIARRGIS